MFEILEEDALDVLETVKDKDLDFSFSIDNLDLDNFSLSITEIY